MARIRSVHPSLWTDEAFLELSIKAKLFIIALWNECDDGGAFEWKPKQLKVRLFGCDEMDTPVLLEELRVANFLTPYEVDGSRYGAIRSFGKFQKPNKPTRTHPMPKALRVYAKTDGIGPDPLPDDNRTLTVASGDATELLPKEDGSSSMALPPGEEGRGKGEEEEDPSLRSGRGAPADPPLAERSPPSAAADPSPDPTKAFFDEAKPALGRLLDKPPSAVGAPLGRLRQAFRDDGRLLDQIRAAEADRPADPMAWLMARRSPPAAASTAQDAKLSPCPEDPPEAWEALADGYEVDKRTGKRHPVVGGYYLDLSARDVANAAGYRWDWRGDWQTLATWMRDKIHIDEAILPTIRRIAARPDYHPPGTLRFFDRAVRAAA